MSAPLALGSAGVWGTADFLGGIATRRSAAFPVVVSSQLAGLVALAMLLPFLPGSPLGVDVAWGAVGGLFGSAGLVLFFAGMARGPISLVSPLAAVTTAIIPFTVGIAEGDRPSALALVGVGAGLAAIVLSGGVRSSRTTGERGWLALSIAAGIGFGLFFVALSRTGSDAGLWPLMGARGTVVIVAAVAWLAKRIRLVPADRPTAIIALISGVLDMAANALFLLAVRLGPLSLTSVLASLYPVVTVILAGIVLHERLVVHQRAGVVLALAGAALIAAG